MVCTSYYAKAAKLCNDNFVFISVSTSVPKWWDKPIIRLSEVYPGWELVNGIKNGTMTEAEYTEKYLAMLNSLNRDEIVDKIRFAAVESSTVPKLQARDVLLLCYETPDKFCHRHILGDWIGDVREFTNFTYGEYDEQINERVREYMPKPKVRMPNDDDDMCR